MKVFIVNALDEKKEISWEKFSEMQREKEERTEKEYTTIYYFTISKIDLDKQELWVYETQSYYHC